MLIDQKKKQAFPLNTFLVLLKGQGDLIAEGQGHDRLAILKYATLYMNTNIFCCIAYTLNITNITRH